MAKSSKSKDKRPSNTSSGPKTRSSASRSSSGTATAVVSSKPKASTDKGRKTRDRNAVHDLNDLQVMGDLQGRLGAGKKKQVLAQKKDATSSATAGDLAESLGKTL